VTDRVAGRAATRPAGGPTTSRRPVLLVAAAAIIHDGTVLAARRTAPPASAGRWELPGGKVEAGESPEQAAVREVAEELGVGIRAGARLGRRHPIRPGMALVVVRASLTGPVPTSSVVHDQLRWLGPDELDEVDWLPADRPLLKLLRAALSAAPPPGAAGPAGPPRAAAVRRAGAVRRAAAGAGPPTPARHPSACS